MKIIQSKKPQKWCYLKKKPPENEDDTAKHENEDHTAEKTTKIVI